MRSLVMLAMTPVLALAACGSDPQPRDAGPGIAVRSPEQDQLHQLPAPDLAIALKRAILASGFRCQRVETAGFVAKHENLDMWTATCSEGREWAIFAGPDGSAQVRDCADVQQAGLPQCAISKQPQSSASG